MNGWPFSFDKYPVPSQSLKDIIPLIVTENKLPPHPLITGKHARGPGWWWGLGSRSFWDERLILFCFSSCFSSSLVTPWESYGTDFIKSKSCGSQWAEGWWADGNGGELSGLWKREMVFGVGFLSISFLLLRTGRLSFFSVHTVSTERGVGATGAFIRPVGLCHVSTQGGEMWRPWECPGKCPLGCLLYSALLGTLNNL